MATGTDVPGTSIVNPYQEKPATTAQSGRSSDLVRTDSLWFQFDFHPHFVSATPFSSPLILTIACTPYILLSFHGLHRVKFNCHMSVYVRAA